MTPPMTTRFNSWCRNELGANKQTGKVLRVLEKRALEKDVVFEGVGSASVRKL